VLTPVVTKSLELVAMCVNTCVYQIFRISGHVG
jgi:hypothetical protein